MVYINNWQKFQEAAESLYEKSPQDARYCVKWRGVDGFLILKITDNTTCVKYKTHSSIFLNRFETLNHNLMRKMQNKRDMPPSSNAGIQTPTAEGAAGTSGTGVAAQSGSSAIPAAGGPAGGSVKKKKGKKKK